MEPNRHPLPLYKSILILLLVAFGCIITILVPADLTCRSNINQWIPLYPDAITISSEHNFIRSPAMGTSTVILLSMDDEETIKQFYRDNFMALLDEEKSRGLATTRWFVEPNPDGEGTFITLYSECGI